MPECSLIPNSFSYSRTFNSYLPFKFLIFYHCSFLYMLSICVNLSAGAQNIMGAYVIIMLVCRRLLTMRLPRKAAV